MPDAENIRIISKEETDDGWDFIVEVRGGAAQTQHTVAVEEDYATQFKYEEPDELVIASFLFLLGREDNEDILPVFKLSDIPSYFPEYEEQVENYL